MSHDTPSRGRRTALTDSLQDLAARQPAGPARRIRQPDAPPEPAARREQSRSIQLAAEVDRLLAELSETRRALAELAARADTDPLLDILNRRGFERELGRALAYVKRYGSSAALVYLDLDGFKAVNDTHGHAAGDALLKAVAETLRRRVRASDVIARLGGDEFAILLWNLSETDAHTKARVLEDEIGRTEIRHDGARLLAAGSAGATMLEPLDTAADALSRADAAMYARKAARRAARG